MHVKQSLATLLTISILLGVLPMEAAAEPPTSTVIEAESAAPRAEGTWYEQPNVRTTADAECSGGKFYFAQGFDTAIGSKVEFTLSAPTAGTYDIYVTTKDNIDRAVFQFYAGETMLGEPIDFFTPKDDYVGQWGTYREHKLGSVELNEGSFTLQGIITGKNPAGSESKYYGGVFDCFRLVEAEPEEPITVVHKESFYSSKAPEGLTLTEGWTIVSSGKAGDDYALNAAFGGTKSLEFSNVTLPATYTMVADVAFMEGETKGTAGFTFSHMDTENFYLFRLDEATQRAQYYLWNKNKADRLVAQESEPSFAVEPGVFYRLRVTYDGENFLCYADGKLMFQYANPSVNTADEKRPSTTGLTGGTIGFRTYNANVLYDNIACYEGVYPPPTGGEQGEQAESPPRARSGAFYPEQ